MKNIFLSNFFRNYPQLIPRVSPESINKVDSQIENLNISALLAIAREQIYYAGTILEKYLYTSLGKAQKINQDNLIDYRLGFCMPLFIILSCFNLRATINSETESEMIERKKYILNTQGIFLKDVHRKEKQKILAIATKIFNYCEDNPYIDNDFYRMGVIISLTTFREIATQLSRE